MILTFSLSKDIGNVIAKNPFSFITEGFELQLLATVHFSDNYISKGCDIECHDWLNYKGIVTELFSGSDSGFRILSSELQL